MKQSEMVITLQSFVEELEGILSRFQRTRDSIDIDQKDHARFAELALELRDIFEDEFVDGERHSQQILRYYNDAIANYFGSPSYRGVENIKGAASAALSRVRRNPLALKGTAFSAQTRGAKDPDTVVALAERLHLVVRQLRERHDDRMTLNVNDEYDLQDLFHALLRIYFDDVRNEEWVPSYAGGSSRMDFLLPEIEAVVEVKMARSTLSTKKLGEQLIIDIAKYRKHPGCRTLFCLVYDPDGRIANPSGVENDLTEDGDEMSVRAMIVPNRRHTLKDKP